LIFDSLLGRAGATAEASRLHVGLIEDDILSRKGGIRDAILTSQPEQVSAVPIYGVAVDMGASHLRFVLADARGQILEEARERVQSEAGARGVIAQISGGIGRLVPEGESLRGIAIGVPGAVHPQTGKVFEANNVPGWREVDLGQELEDAFQVPVFLDNDANMAAIGEHWRGVARGVDNFVFIALGTGIGAGVFVNGRICRGHSGSAGEIFKMNVDWTKWNDDFPDTGQFETYVSGLGLAAEGRKVLPSGNGVNASTLAEERDARFVFNAMHQGNAQARAVIENSFTMLGVGVANLVSVLDPELVVLNGGVVQGAPELLLETVETVVRRIHPRPPIIRLSSLGDKAQIWGALSTLLAPTAQFAIRPATLPLNQ
jgi:predicted NBD/HSP70 family sugar kinase